MEPREDAKKVWRPSFSTLSIPSSARVSLSSASAAIRSFEPTHAHWVPEAKVTHCANGCGTKFSRTVRKHHCRRCGHVFCAAHSKQKLCLDADAQYTLKGGALCRVCDTCFAEGKHILEVRQQDQAEATEPHVAAEPGAPAAPSPPPAVPVAAPQPDGVVHLHTAEVVACKNHTGSFQTQRAAAIGQPNAQRVAEHAVGAAYEQLARSCKADKELLPTQLGALMSATKSLGEMAIPRPEIPWDAAGTPKLCGGCASPFGPLRWKHPCELCAGWFCEGCLSAQPEPRAHSFTLTACKVCWTRVRSWVLAQATAAQRAAACDAPLARSGHTLIAAMQCSRALLGTYEHQVREVERLAPRTSAVACSDVLQRAVETQQQLEAALPALMVAAKQVGGVTPASPTEGAVRDAAYAAAATFLRASYPRFHQLKRRLEHDASLAQRREAKRQEANAAKAQALAEAEAALARVEASVAAAAAKQAAVTAEQAEKAKFKQMGLTDEEAAEWTRITTRVKLEHAFLDAAKAFDFERVRAFVLETPDLVNAQPAKRLSALHQAAAASNSGMVAWLIEHDADPGLVSRDGQTALDICWDHETQAFLAAAATKRAAAAATAAGEAPAQETAQATAQVTGQADADCGLPPGVTPAQWATMEAMRKMVRARQHWRQIRVAVAASAGMKFWHAQLVDNGSSWNAASTIGVVSAAPGAGEEATDGQASQDGPRATILEMLMSKLPDEGQAELQNALRAVRTIADRAGKYRFGDITRSLLGSRAPERAIENAEENGEEEGDGHGPSVGPGEGDDAGGLAAAGGPTRAEYTLGRAAFVELSRGSILVASDRRLHSVPQLAGVQREEMQAALDAFTAALMAGANSLGLHEASETLSLTTLITMPFSEYVATVEGRSSGLPPLSAATFQAASTEELVSRVLSITLSVSHRIEEDVSASSFDGVRSAMQALTRALDTIFASLLTEAPVPTLVPPGSPALPVPSMPALPPTPSPPAPSGATPTPLFGPGTANGVPPPPPRPSSK